VNSAFVQIPAETREGKTRTAESSYEDVGRVSDHAGQDSGDGARRPYIDDLGIDLGHRGLSSGS
jgi:hypothetical protein